MTIAINVRHDDQPPSNSIVVSVRPDQDLANLVLGLSQIFGSTKADNLWVQGEGGAWRMIGDDVRASTVGEHLAERTMHDAVLSEGAPSVIRGSTA